MYVYYMYVYWEYELSRILWATPHIFPLSNHVQLFLWNSCISHPDKHVNHIYASIENAKHKISRCVLSFFHFISIICQYWPGLLHLIPLTIFKHKYTNLPPPPLCLYTRLCIEREAPSCSWSRLVFEIAASVKRQFEVIRLVLVGGTLPSTICDTVIQGKEPCRSEKKY